jgi:hypothetical protein
MRDVKFNGRNWLVQNGILKKPYWGPSHSGLVYMILCMQFFPVFRQAYADEMAENYLINGHSSKVSNWQSIDEVHCF